jgi:hypothetical protein
VAVGVVDEHACMLRTLRGTFGGVRFLGRMFPNGLGCEGMESLVWRGISKNKGKNKGIANAL